MNRRHFLATALAAVPLSSRAWASVLDPQEIAFLVVGDWGTGGALQRRVAASMTKVARKSNATFVLSTGDNIYPDGVTSAADPQWKTKFEKIYADLGLPWWAALGNHDHRGEPDAQIAYAKVNPLWNMPGRTWRQNVNVDAVTKLAILALDTTPIVQGASQWRDQLTWLDRSLTQEPASLRVVVGHHPLRSYGHYGDTQTLVKNLKPLLDKHSVNAYLCGHEHDMQLIRDPGDRFACLVSGGGGGERPSRPGPNTKLSFTGGGFALMRARGAELSVEMFDSYGVSRGRYEL
ncbi:MAG: purple acid phosphatase family protein [Bacteroidota bacterium]